ncbi:MAG: hypothetical protein P1U74_03790 [Legionellaceae bacterium]|nr:hypothetical protein [Legionellaceae bacterium]
MFVLLGLILPLASCLSWEQTDYASNDKDQYLTSKSGPALVVPPPLTTVNISDFYILPNQNENAKVSINPPPAN